MRFVEGTPGVQKGVWDVEEASSAGNKSFWFLSVIPAFTIIADTVGTLHERPNRSGHPCKSG